MRSADLVLLFSVTSSHVQHPVVGTLLPARVVEADERAASEQSADVRRFQEYPITTTFRGPAAPARIDSARYGRMFRTRLREGARRGPNFAGEFTVVTWGCGTSCQFVAVVNARTGRHRAGNVHHVEPRPRTYGTAVNSHLSERGPILI